MSKQAIGNGYIVECALYLINGARGSGAHHWLGNHVQEVRPFSFENEPITYAEASQYVTELVGKWEAAVNLEM